MRREGVVPGSHFLFEVDDVADVCLLAGPHRIHLYERVHARRTSALHPRGSSAHGTIRRCTYCWPMWGNSAASRKLCRGAAPRLAARPSYTISQAQREVRRETKPTLGGSERSRRTNATCNFRKSPAPVLLGTRASQLHQRPSHRQIGRRSRRASIYIYQVLPPKAHLRRPYPRRRPRGLSSG